MYHLNHFSVSSSVALSTFTLLGKHHHHAELSRLPKLTLSPLNTDSPFPFPSPCPTVYVLSLWI